MSRWLRCRQRGPLMTDLGASARSTTSEAAGKASRVAVRPVLQRPQLALLTELAVLPVDQDVVVGEHEHDQVGWVGTQLLEGTVAPTDAAGPVVEDALVTGHGAQHRRAAALEHGGQMPALLLGHDDGRGQVHGGLGVAHEHDPGLALEVAEVTEVELGVAGAHAALGTLFGDVTESLHERRPESSRYWPPMLVDSVDPTIAIGILAAVGQAVTVAVGVARVRPEALLSPAPEVVTVVILGRVDDPVAVAIGEQV